MTDEQSPDQIAASITIDRAAGSAVVIDGVDISRAVRFASLRLGRDAKPWLEVHLDVTGRTAVDGSVELVVRPDIEQALVALGWTPPAERADG